MPYVYQTGEIEAIEVQYQAGEPLERLAEQYSKSVASIRMKLVKRGTYVKQAKPAAKTITSSTEVTKPQATTKGEVLAQYKQALGWVGAAPW